MRKTPAPGGEPDPAVVLGRNDKRIDVLVERAEKLVLDLNTTVADMKRILLAAATDAREARNDTEQPAAE